MNQQLLTIFNLIKAQFNISEEVKSGMLKTLNEADKALKYFEKTSKQAESNKSTSEALTRSLEDLKAAKAQLIRAEKMSSLGVLTAGIMHEIQNPLNFVNNFSEVSKEFLEEMKVELDKGNFDHAKAIANDLTKNLEKIHHHGKRADSIVKGMLQYSRKNTHERELTDINVLIDEYLHLAYHGLRARDRSFNAILETDYDYTIGKIKIVPQDIGRVALNLITNAFYAVEKKRTKALTSSKLEQYNPTVQLSTKKLDGTVVITIKDNGNGIPPKVLDKIFQPFFTTKPSGEGTGLGLSLSYDIIKAHGGELTVTTESHKYTEFKIVLPTLNLENE